MYAKEVKCDRQTDREKERERQKESERKGTSMCSKFGSPHSLAQKVSLYMEQCIGRGDRNRHDRGGRGGGGRAERTKQCPRTRQAVHACSE